MHLINRLFLFLSISMRNFLSLPFFYFQIKTTCSTHPKTYYQLNSFSTYQFFLLFIISNLKYILYILLNHLISNPYILDRYKFIDFYQKLQSIFCPKPVYFHIMSLGRNFVCDLKIRCYLQNTFHSHCIF